MTTFFSDGFDRYGAEKVAEPFGKWPLLNAKDETHLMGPGIDLRVSRLPSGKWSLKVNGVEMIFDRHPEFVVARLLAPADTLPKGQDRETGLGAEQG